MKLRFDESSASARGTLQAQGVEILLRPRDEPSQFQSNRALVIYSGLLRVPASISGDDQLGIEPATA